MKLKLLFFSMIAAGAAGTACGASASSSGTGEVTGGGGSDGSTTTGDSATAAQSGSAQAGAGSSGTSGTSGAGGGGGGGGFPANCADTADCGNFGGGCIKCAAKSACAAEYQACFDDAPCKAYSLCIEPCGAKELDCLQKCQNQYPSGATEYQALIHCVICGDCSTLCVHAPDTCK
jgi:hypothetical protein